MVQFKRKPVQYLPPPQFLDDNTEVWVIEKTGEVFSSYESYLQRRDFYNQKKFTCDITGHSGLTFFEALESEMEESKDVDNTFPEALREHVLRKVQFCTIGRMEDVVSYVFSEFKDDFFPRERVSVYMADGAKLEGVIREKIQFPKMRQPDGTVTEAYSRYFVSIESLPGQEAMADAKHLTRDRYSFTKAKLKSFLKNSIARESWFGAPWLVKEQLARQYNISTMIPPHLHQNARPADKKATKGKGDQETTFFSFFASQNQHRPLAAKRQPKAQNSANTPFEALDPEQSLMRAKYPAFSANPGANGFPHAPGPGQGFFDILNRVPGYQAKGQEGWRSTPSDMTPNSFPSSDVPRKWIPTPHVPSEPPRPPPPTYPMEDTELPLKRSASGKENLEPRPSLNFFTDDVPEGVKTAGSGNGILMRSVGSLLEIWNLLNVHDKIFYLDSFTFDDFVDAMRFPSVDVECELLSEIHCSALKQLVNENGEVQVSLPSVDEDEHGDDSEAESSKESSPETEPEMKPPARSTRSSLAKAEAAALKARSPSPVEPEQKHRADEMFADVDWIERLKLRDFKNGGWQFILTGLIWRMSSFEPKKEICEEILAQLAPLDMEPTQETARFQYGDLDVNLRVAALEMAAMLTVQTQTFRNHLEKCSNEMTEIRKERMEFQRAKKPLVEELRQLDEQRKILLPDNMPSSPPPEVTESPDISMTGITETEDAENDEEGGSEDEVPRNGRALRRANDRANERKRKREEEIARKEKEKKDKADAAKNKQSAEWKKLLKNIEKKKEEIKKCEMSIAECENDLREANCQRTKLLGIDRFCNRYYWFERNGMPYAGLPNSSTAHYGYANGRVWVQGPEKADLDGLCNLPKDELERHKEQFSMTPWERKEKSEGSTRLVNAHQWGYYDDPEAIDQLLAWLDERGVREKPLIKELEIYREPIVEHMKKLKEHLTEVEEKKAAGEEQTTRVSTRTKTYVDLDATKHQCLAWKNTAALHELGHLHSDHPRPRKQKKLAESKTAKVPLGKTGKPLTRQGQRYGNI